MRYLIALLLAVAITLAALFGGEEPKSVEIQEPAPAPMPSPLTDGTAKQPIKQVVSKPSAPPKGNVNYARADSQLRRVGITAPTDAQRSAGYTILAEHNSVHRPLRKKHARLMNTLLREAIALGLPLEKLKKSKGGYTWTRASHESVIIFSGGQILRVPQGTHPEINALFLAMEFLTKEKKRKLLALKGMD